MSNKINEVTGVIISRSLLEEYGYDGDMPSDEEMQTIADELLEYWGESDGATALSSSVESKTPLWHVLLRKALTLKIPS